MTSGTSRGGFWKVNGNLTIKTQILLICLFCSTMIFGISLTAILVGQEFITKVLQAASNQIFEQQTQVLLNNIWIYKHGMEELIEITKHQISLVRNLNRFVEGKQKQNHSFHIQEPKMCLNKPKDQDQYCFNNTMCCGVFGTPLNQSLKNQLVNIMITTSLLNVYRLEFDFTIYAPIYFAYNNEAQYYCHSSGFPFPSTYRPFQRPYYGEHLKSIANTTDPEKCYFANPYKILYNMMRLPMTTSLLDLDNQFIGVAAKDLDFNYSYIEKYYLQNITSQIITSDGLVVFTAKYREANQPVYYLNDSQYSGFSQDDYQQIMLRHYGKQFKSNCANFQSDNILCRYNSELIDNVIVQTSNITGSPYIMLILSKTNEIKQYESNHFAFLSSELSLLINRNIIIIILSSLGIIIFSQILIIVILRQLNNIIDKINTEIKSNKSQITDHSTLQASLKNLNSIGQQNSQLSTLLNSQSNIVQSNTVTDLTSSCVGLFHNNNYQTKCFECRYQEEIIYPNQDKPQLRNLKFTRKQFLSLRNRSRFSRNLKDMIYMIQIKHNL